MSKKYRIDYVIGNRQALSATKALTKEMEQLDAAARKAGASMGAAAAGRGSGSGAAMAAAATTTAAASTKRRADAQRAAIRQEIAEARAAGAVLLTDKTKHIAQMEALERGWRVREYKGRVAYDQNLQRSAKQRGDIESRWAADDYKRRVRSEQSKIKEAERTAESLSSLEDRYAEKEYKGRVAWEAKKQQAAKKEAEKTVREKRKEAEDIAAMEQRWLQREYSERVAYQRKKEKQAEAEARAIERVQQTYMRREYRDRTAHQKRLQRLAEQQASATQKAIGRAAASFTGFASAATGAGAALAGLEVGKRIIGELAGAFNDAKASAMTMAEKTLETLAALREIASIRGKGAPDTKDLEQHLRIREASGLTGTEAERYENQLFNALGTVSEERISKAERQKLAISGSQAAARWGGGVEGIQAQAMIQGMLANYMPKGSTAKDIVRKAEKVNDVLGLGTTDARKGTQEYVKLMTTLTGPEGADLKGYFNDPTKAAGLIALSSTFAPENPAEATLQAVRGLHGITKETKAKGAKSTQAQTLRDAGIKETDQPDVVLMKMFRYADKNFKGEAFYAAMARRGFRNIQDSEQIGKMYAKYKSGDFQRIMGIASQGPAPDLVEKKQAAFEASETGQKLMATQAKEAAVVREGMNHTVLNIAKDRAEAKLTDEGIDTKTSGALTKRVASVFTVGADGKSVLAEDRAIQDLREQAGLRRKDWVRENLIERAAPRALMNFLMPGAGFLPQSVPGMNPLSIGMGAAYEHFAGGGSAEARQLKTAVDKNTEAIVAQNKLIQQRRGVPQAPPAMPGPPAGGPIRPGS